MWERERGLRSPEKDSDLVLFRTPQSSLSLTWCTRKPTVYLHHHASQHLQAASKNMSELYYSGNIHVPEYNILQKSILGHRWWLCHGPVMAWWYSRCLASSRWQVQIPLVPWLFLTCFNYKIEHMIFIYRVQAESSYLVSYVRNQMNIAHLSQVKLYQKWFFIF